MKNSILKITICLCAILFFANCSKDDDNSNEEETISTDGIFIKAKVDGVNFEIQDPFLFAVDSNIGGINFISIGANSDDETSSINIGLSNVNSTGTYTLLNTLNEEDVLASSYISSLIYSQEDTAWFAGTLFGNNDVSATVNITEFNESFVAGTFHFTGYDIVSETEKTITDGEFRVKRLIVFD